MLCSDFFSRPAIDREHRKTEKTERAVEEYDSVPLGSLDGS